MRVFLISLASLLVCLLITPFFLFRPFHPENGEWGLRIIRSFAFKILGLKVIVKNSHFLSPSMPPSIIIGNHQHWLDAFLFGCHLPPRSLSIGKDTLKYVPFFGVAYWLAGHFFIRRNHTLSSLETLASVKKKLLETRSSLLMMPEGTRSHGKGLGKFKKGAFYLATELQYPIQPLVCSTLDQFVHLNKWKAGTVIMEALPPLSTQGFTKNNLDDLILSSRTIIQEAVKRLDEEVLESTKKRQF